MSTASLGFKIDSSQASSAAVDLEKLIAAAGKLDRAADSLEASTRGLNDALGKVGHGAQKAKTETESVGRSFQQQDDHVRSFRMELDRLTAKFQPMAAATKQYETAVGEINRAHQLGIINAQQMQKALDGERMAYERLKTSATTAGAAVQAANSNRASGASRAAAVNAGYQFQDIAVTASMGMSPLMIGMQQGMQLASVVGSMEKPVAGLAAAFASLLSPVSLVTIGLTAGVAALIQYFSTSSEGTDGMSEDLRAQNDLIAKVAERWGDATPRLKEYADELTRVAEANERMAAGNAAAEQQFAKIVDVLGTINREYMAAMRDLRGGGEETAQVFRKLSGSFAELQSKIMDGKATANDLQSTQTAMADAVKQFGTPAIVALSDAFKGLTPNIEAAIKASGDFRREGVFNPGMNRSFQSYPGAEYSPDGPIQNESYQLPEIGPVPTRRPSDLEARPGDISGGAMILNSDGKLVAVPTPTARPNYFEREADMPFLSGGRQGAQWDRAVLQEEFRRGEMKSLFTGFFTDFRSALEQNGGNLGKAFAQSFSNALMNEAGKLWDKLFSQVADGLVNAIMGGPSQALLNKQAGFTGANTTLGSLLGAELAGGGNKTANDNLPAPATDIAAYITQAAVKRGIDPNVALNVAKSEGGLNSWNLQSGFVKNGVREQSFGPFQLYKGGGLGNEFMSKTGLDPALAANGPAATDFALDHAAKNGWGAWYGAKRVGIGNWEGIGANAGAGSAASAVTDLAKSAGSAAKSVDVFGGGLGKMGQALSTSYFPSAPSGGGGGLLGMLGGIFGGGLSSYGKSAISASSQFASAWSKGGIGLYASGTNYAPGGMAIVGEEGPELVNLPQGSQVFSNSRSKALMANDNGGSSSAQARPLTVVVQGASGDNHIRELARQGAQEAVYQDRIEQERGRFGKTQQTYNARKG